MPFTGTCTTAEKLPVTVVPQTDSTPPKPAPIDGSISVSVQSGTGSATVTSATTFEAVSGDEPGDTVILVEADADLGAGVITISDTYTLTVTSETAKHFGMTSGAALPKVDAPSPSARKK